VKAICKQCGVDEPDHGETCPFGLRERLELRILERNRAEDRVVELEAGIRRYVAAWEAIGDDDYRHELNAAERALWALVGKVR